MVSSIRQSMERHSPDIAFRYDQHKIQKSSQKNEPKCSKLSEKEILGSIFYTLGKNLIKRCELTTQLERQKSQLSIIENGYTHLKALIGQAEFKVRQLRRDFLSCNEEVRASLPHLMEAAISKEIFLQLQAFLSVSPQLSQRILEGHNIVTNWVDETAIKLDELSDQVYILNQGNFTEEVPFKDLLLIFIEVFKKYNALQNKRLPCCLQNVKCLSSSKSLGSVA